MQISKLLFVVVLLFGTLSLEGQINIVAGYNGGYTQADNYNNILARHNLSQDSLEQSYEDLHFLNGITVGLNYRIDDISIEALWIERSRQLRTRGIDVETGRLFTNDISNRLRTISFGLNAHLKNFIVGGTINADLLRINYDTRTTEETTLTKQNDYSSRFYAGFFVKANQALSISLRPYVQIPWNSFDLSDLDQALNGTQDKVEEDFMHFGISLYIYNGSQKNQRYRY